MQALLQSGGICWHEISMNQILLPHIPNAIVRSIGHNLSHQSLLFTFDHSHVATRPKTTPTSTNIMADGASSSTLKTPSQQSPSATNLRESVVESGLLTPEAQIATSAVSQHNENVNAEMPSTGVGSSPFHIMELPKEMCLMIYEFVFQDILNGVSPVRYPSRPGENAALKVAMRDRLRRVLALVHTSHTFHTESIGVGQKLVAAFRASIKDGFDGSWYRRPGEEGDQVISATMDAKRRLRELKSMKLLSYDRHW